ncbi:MAG TPA: flagellar filament capping protein FliD [Trinickia sp.]|nr:flagellar filament capping protein FliD [Trinickia sp.]
MSTPTSSTSTILQQAAQSILSGATGSSLDVNSLVNALVLGKTAAQQATINNAISNDKTLISSLGSVQSALSGIVTSLGGLSDGSIFTQLAATFSGTGITATTTTGSAAGAYAVSVQQLATANQISSQAYAANATLGTGNLTIGVGANNITIALTGSNNTLAGVAAAINGASNNPGVTASVVTASDGQHLVLTSTQTGAANTVTVSHGAGVDAGLATASFAQVTVAQDAKLTISGNSLTSASNSVSGGLTGVTLNLTQAAVGTSQTLTVGTNGSAITTALQNFTSAYNNWISNVAAPLSSFNPNAAPGQQAGPLLGDAMLNSAMNGVSTIVANGVTVGGNTYSLADIGLNLNGDGTLTFTASTLQATLTSSPSTVSSLFNGTNGIGQQLNSFISSYTNSTTGQIAQRDSAINADLNTQNQALTSLNAYAATLNAQYQAQFTQLNTLLSQTANSTSYLNQLFGGGGLSGTLNKH